MPGCGTQKLPRTGPGHLVLVAAWPFATLGATQTPDLGTSTQRMCSSGTDIIFSVAGCQFGLEFMADSFP